MFRPHADPYVRHPPASAAVANGGVDVVAESLDRLTADPLRAPDRPQRRRAADPICAAVDGAFCLRNAHQLIGMSHGQRRDAGVCVIDGRPATFDYWFPHLGIAVDTLIDRATSDAKLIWATEQSVLYFSAYANNTEQEQINVELLTIVANERRGH